MLRTHRVVKPGDSIRGENCRHCTKAIRLGEVVAYATMYDAPGYRRLFVVHVSCLKAVVAAAPVEDFEAEFEALRAEMVRTGSAFPDD